MANQMNKHTLPAWTEIEYTAACKNPYLDTPFFIPKEAKVFLCREDGTREEQRMIFLVFKSTTAPEDAEWEDDPVPGENWVRPLGDDDEEIEPAKMIYLEQNPETFFHLEDEDDDRISFNIYWRHGSVKMEKAEVDDELYTCQKEDFGEEGLRLTLTPEEEEGNPFSMLVKIPYIGFSLYDGEGNKVHGDIEIPHDKVEEYAYDFIGNDSNDRFTLQLDGNKLVYICVLRHEDNKLIVRDQRQRLAVVDELPVEGKLTQLLMNAHSALVKNKNYRWRIEISGSSIAHEVELDIHPASLIAFVKEQMAKGTDIDTLGQQLIALEQKYKFQWCWLMENDWEHGDPMFDMFMTQLCGFSYVSQKPIQGDALQARNNKRKIRRCAKLMKAHQAGELSLWDEDEEQRQEILHLFSTFHSQFVEELEKEEEE